MVNANLITALTNDDDLGPADRTSAKHLDAGADPVLQTECERVASERAAELAQMYESLQRRERLLAASANASRMLLEAPDVMAAVPHVFRQLGEAAVVDRVNLMLTQTGPAGERLMVVASEWVAEGVVPHL